MHKYVKLYIFQFTLSGFDYLSTCLFKIKLQCRVKKWTIKPTEKKAIKTNLFRIKFYFLSFTINFFTRHCNSNFYILFK